MKATKDLNFTKTLVCIVLVISVVFLICENIRLSKECKDLNNQLENVYNYEKLQLQTDTSDAKTLRVQFESTIR